jgi:hypothetical protein
MAMHNIPARVHRTVVKLKIKVEILESSSKKRQLQVITYINSFLDIVHQTFKILGKSKIGYKYKLNKYRELQFKET